MFTGIVEGKAELTSVEQFDGFTRWVVDLPPKHGENLEIGASVALDGVCLTVVEIDGDSVSFDLGILGHTQRRMHVQDSHLWRKLYNC